MKIRESKRIIREEKEDAPLRISGRDGKRRDRVAMYHEKDNEHIKHGTYRTPGGAYYNRYYVRDEYGDGDELNCKGVVGPFTTEEEAEQAMKDYKPNAIKESYNRRRRLKESDDIKLDKFYDLWKEGTLRVHNEVYHYWAKVYETGSQYGIDGGRVSKLTIRRNGKTVAHYDRGWDVTPVDRNTQLALKLILDQYK